MAIQITNMVAGATDYEFTATAETAVTDIIIYNTDVDAGSGFEWEMHIIKSGGTKGVNTQVLKTITMNSTPTGFGGTIAVPPVIFAGSQISVNTITGNFSEKWILETGDKIVIVLDDTSTTGFIGGTLGSANASPTWADNVIASMDTFGAADALRTVGTYNGVTGTSGGSGTVGTFDIIIGVGGAVTSVAVATGGTGHSINDTITIADAVLGGGGAAALTMDVATLVNNKATVPVNLFINHILV